MSDRDRDELADLIYDVTGLGGDVWVAVSDIRSESDLADALIAAGYRKTVTPEQILRATRKLDTVSAIVTSLATDAANALKEIDNIRAGLVPEDGEQ